MPLLKRAIEPQHISRVVVDGVIANELEYVANCTLANIIRQLGSLSAHAEDLFTELHRETCYVLSRSAQLSQRVDRLKVKITQLNPTVQEVSLYDINMRKPFKSSVIQDQQIATVETRPKAVTDCYNRCDAPPALDKLNAYREDGKDSMKFYTDPNYFFDLWCQEMASETEVQKAKHKHRNKKAHPNNSQPKAIRAPRSHVEDLNRLRHGPELADINNAAVIYQATVTNTGSNSRPVSLIVTQPATSQQHVARRTSEYSSHIVSAPGTNSVDKDIGPFSPPVDSSGYLQTSASRARITPLSPNSRYSDISVVSRPLGPPPAPPATPPPSGNVSSPTSSVAVLSGRNTNLSSGYSTAKPVDAVTSLANLAQPPANVVAASNNLVQSNSNVTSPSYAIHTSRSERITSRQVPQYQPVALTGFDTLPTPPPIPDTIYTSQPVQFVPVSAAIAQQPSTLSSLPDIKSQPYQAGISAFSATSAGSYSLPSPPIMPSNLHYFDTEVLPDITDLPIVPPPPSSPPYSSTINNLPSVPPPPPPMLSEDLTSSVVTRDSLPPASSPPPPVMSENSSVPVGLEGVEVKAVHGSDSSSETVLCPPTPPPLKLDSSAPPAAPASSSVINPPVTAIPPPAVTNLPSIPSLPPAGIGINSAMLHDARKQLQSNSGNLESAAATTSPGSLTAKSSFSAGKPVIRETRSDLLAAIRQGFQLRKVEEHRQQTEKKQQTSTGRHLDVQSIMEAAFERRRQAIEENESDGEDDNDNEWDDED